MIKRLLCAGLLSLALLIPARSEALELTADRALAFADRLFDQGDYYRAITEYERVLFYYPQQTETADTARFQIALAYQKGEKWDAALDRFRALAEERADQTIGERALFMVGETCFLKKDYILAADAYDAFLKRYPLAGEADAARLRRGVCYLQLRQWALASEAFGSLPADSPQQELGRQLATATARHPEIPTRSPALAAGLSALLPGAGQLYVKRPKDALTSFLLNGLFIWGAVESFEHGNPVVGGLLTAIETTWYTGNIYNAASSAHKFNRYQEQQFIDNLRGEYGLACYRDAQGHTLLALNMRF